MNKTLSLAVLSLVLVPVLALATTLTPSITAPANNSNVTVNTPVTFTGSATGGDAPYSYVWTFGDATSAFGESYSKTYTATGTKTVRLTVNDHNAIEAETTITINVVEASNTDPLTITNIRVTDVTQTGAIIRWTTNRVANSRAIYDTVSHSDISGQTAPNFGYANSTATSDSDPKVLEHAVTVSSLSANTQYFFRVISQE
ncbi:MAG: PKD domain-containing protein [bacterium]|nr:PKD domain-containing protein [bacterium]